MRPGNSPFLAIQIWLRNGRRESGWILKRYLLVQNVEIFVFGKMDIAIQNLVLLRVTYVENVVEGFRETVCLMKHSFLSFFVKK
jgi:hypothetical protein